MRTILAGILLPITLPVSGADPIPGKISCHKGVDIAKVQALVKKTVTALRMEIDI
jgi:hypothetical protein